VRIWSVFLRQNAADVSYFLLPHSRIRHIEVGSVYLLQHDYVVDFTKAFFYNQNDVWFHGTLVNVISLCPKGKHSIPGADCHKTYKRRTLLHATCFISFTHLRTWIWKVQTLIYVRPKVKYGFLCCGFYETHTNTIIYQNPLVSNFIPLWPTMWRIRS